MIMRNPPEEEGLSLAAVTSSLAVLDRLIDINQTAHINEGFTTIVETISACIPEGLIAPNTQ